jgi:hypothetical protein
MWHGALPGCCERCEVYDRVAGRCRLLADPTVENRRALVSMPCDIEALIARRLRAQGEEIGQEALQAWLAADLTADEVTASFGQVPLDARLWLTSWPYLFLARGAVRRRNPPSPSREAGPPPEGGDPELGGCMIRTLDQLLGVDPIGYALMLDLLRGELDDAKWCEALGCNDKALGERSHLALYRYAVIFHDVLGGLPDAPRAALAARRFARANHTDAEALEATRTATGMTLSPEDWRRLYREGVMGSLVALARPEALGPEAMDELDGTFRRVLRVEGAAQ